MFESGDEAEVEPGAEPLQEFAAVMRRLRAECPWKASQTHRSLSRYLLEEAYETLEAIDAGEASGDWTHLREELGDLLLQVYFHGVLAEEAGAFTLDDVARDITAKMRRRNPHVFGDASARGSAHGLDPAAVNELWEAEKAREKRRDGLLDGVPAALPALLLALKALDRLERADPEALPGTPAPGSPQPPTTPTSVTGREVGERLLAVVAQARAAGIDPEQALRDVVAELAATPQSAREERR